MKGCLIVNAYLQMQKFDEIYSFLQASFSKRNIDLQMLTNVDALALTFNCEIVYDFVLLWDKDVYLGELLEQIGYKVFNSSNSIRLCDDKALTYLELSKHNIAMPKTIFAPKTFANIGYTNFQFIDTVIEQLQLPLVVKENFGSFGAQVYLAHTKEELISIAMSINAKPFLFQQFVSSSHGRDIRIQVVGGKIIACVERIASGNDFRANVTSGGVMKQYTPTPLQQQMALDVCKILKLDFAGVDILFGEGDAPILCEVNSNAQFKNLFDATGVNAAEHIAQYIEGNIL